MDYLKRDYLCHWGIKGMRWGIRRYQNPDGTLTNAGKKRYGEAPKYVKKELTPEERKARKEAAINSGNAKKVYEAKDDMTNQELRTAIERIDLNKKISSLSKAEETHKGEEAINKILKVVDISTKTMNSLDNALNAYDKLSKYMPPKEDRSHIKKAVNSGEVDQVEKYFDKMTQKELTDAMQRVNYAGQLKKKKAGT